MTRDRTPRHLSTTLLALCLFALAACQTAPGRPVAGHVTIMTFNVENLFDTIDAPGKDDRTYLPLAMKQAPEHRAGCDALPVRQWKDDCLLLDWSESVLEMKLASVAASILANGPDGRGPDVVALQEVENRSVLERLRRDHLAPAGYGPALLIEGNDRRGIDVAFLSRLPIVGQPRLHPVRFDGVGRAAVEDTRGILEADFQLPDGTLMTGFAVHFPAPFHPGAMRVTSYRALADRLSALPSDRLAFAAGDFNTISSEADILDEHVAPLWQIPHRTGCSGCRGTYYYAPDRNWSFLDMVLLARGSERERRWRLDDSRTRVATAFAQQTSAGGTPKRFDPATGKGVGDHWPLIITLRRVAD